MENRTRVLIVDDSRLFREALARVLAQVPDIEVVGAAWNGREALAALDRLAPDVVTLDVDMPILDGPSTLEEIVRYNAGRPGRPPVGVLMLSAHTRQGGDIAVRALQAGAFDVVLKPGAAQVDRLSSLRSQLLTRIRLFMSHRQAAARRPAREGEGDGSARPSAPASAPAEVRGAVVIGVSTGGPRAMTEFLPALCRRVAAPVLVVQHLPVHFSRSMAENLDARCDHRVIEAEDGAAVLARTVYIAPGGRHLTVTGSAEAARIALTEDAPEAGCRPAADALFRTAASVYGPHTAAVILTGMGNDGTAGAAAVKAAGGRVLAQDRQTSVVWGMPGSVAEAGHADAILPLGKLAEAVGAVFGRERTVLMEGA